MRAVLVLLLGLVAAVVLGVGSAYLAVRSPAPVDAISLGAWQAWPNAGTPNVDPYSRARLARNGEIPLGSGEGLPLLARTDDAGAALRSGCDYQIAGITPPARLWTLAVENSNGLTPTSDGEVAALGSDILLRLPNGGFEIALSAQPRAGNWISTQGFGEFRLVVRLYDTTARLVTALTTLAMPRVVRLSCG